MEKQVVFDRADVDEYSQIGLRFRKQFLDDDGSITQLGYHRCVVSPGEDLEATLSMLGDAFVREGAGALKPTPGLDSVRTLVSVLHTKEAIARHKQRNRSF